MTFESCYLVRYMFNKVEVDYNWSVPGKVGVFVAELGVSASESDGGLPGAGAGAGAGLLLAADSNKI